ncbi:MAG: class I SAM-dependent methyltransferase [Candidatus Eremiobacteraeota bacterium]|nr:class I SAM-dependent methyltransferase [Candidatus Eremiobacteraeota bacterium]
MTTVDPGAQYVLGNTQTEHERLARQAMRYDPLSERLFREAGIGPGQRVMDLGSGAGHVSMLAARLVGPSGEVVGVERDPSSVAYAQSRAAQAGLRNVSFTQSDVNLISRTKPFDAAVGRFILMFLPDPVGVLRSLSGFVRPGGVIAFQEVSQALMIRRSENLPLCSASVALIHETLKRSGANPEMGFDLYQAFQDAGLPAPTMRMEMPVGDNQEFALWVADTLQSMRPRMQQLNLSSNSLGDWSTLAKRLQDEAASSRKAAAWFAAVGAWSTTPTTATA